MLTRERKVASAIGLGALAVALAAGGWMLTRPRPPAFHGMAVDPAYPAPEFTLTDHRGRPFSLSSLRGRAVLLYFGYTFCPDVCPATMVQFGAVREALERDAGGVTMLLVTVDPERDTPERMKEYVSHFGPGIIGLTGDPETVGQVLKAYGVYAQKVLVANSATGYLMDHSAMVYLIDPQGRMRVVFPYGTATGAIVHDVRTVLAERGRTRAAMAPAELPAAIRAEGAWARPGSQGGTSAVYLALTNDHGRDDALVAAKGGVAGAVELHETRMEDNVMRMRPVERILLPAGGRVELKPGGPHIMLIGLSKPLNVGDRFTLTLAFEKAGELPVEVEVRQASPHG